MEDIFTSLDSKDFTNFSKAVKSELDTKLADNDSMKTYKSDSDKMLDIKQVLAEINAKNKGE